MWRCSLRAVLREPSVSRGLFCTANTVNPRLSGSCSSASGKQWQRPSGFDTGLKTFNSLTKQKEPLILARERVATWYGSRLALVCNVYDHSRIITQLPAVFQVQLRTHRVRSCPPGTCMVPTSTFSRDVRTFKVCPS